MTFVTIPNRPLGSDTRSIEMILADFDAVTAVINGQLDQTNFSNSGQQGLYLPGDIIVSAAPSRTGCLQCLGQAVSRTLYPALFSAIGTAFGAGDGSSTFNIPDAQGRALVGVGSGVSLVPRPLAQEWGVEAHAHGVPASGLTVGTHAHSLSAAGGATVIGANVAGDDMVEWNASNPGPANTMTRRIRWPSAQGGGTTHIFETISTSLPTSGLVGNTDAYPTINVGGAAATDAQANAQPSIAFNVFIKT
jgi:microcystin-dependent protein